MSAQTRTERYLTRLCRRSFLRLWSWPNVYRRQAFSHGSEGKELCDLLVVFGDGVLLFSDKECAFPHSGNTALDWSRWYKRAVAKSADQIFGAERWLRAYPERVFLDAACKKPLPVPLPQNARFHRIVVAHGVSERCRTHLGGSGSLMLRPDLSGASHFTPSDPNFFPFTVGRVSSELGFVHVIDDAALDVLFLALDTVADFLQYLDRKEAFIESGRLGMAAGEDDLLAFYLKHADSAGHHDFILPDRFDELSIDEGHWQAFTASAERAAQISADRPSYLWDAIIDRFTKHALEGTQYQATPTAIQDLEPALRIMAAESRTQRRALAKSLFAISDRAVSEGRSARVIKPSAAGRPYYVFLALHPPRDVPYDEYRLVRQRLLHAYCLVVRLQFPDAPSVLGIATESSASDATATPGRSEDLAFLTADEWDRDAEKEARRVQSEYQILLNVRESRLHEEEYPLRSQHEMRKGRMRNQPCECGSGRKFKKCHGTAAGRKA